MQPRTVRTLNLIFVDQCRSKPRNGSALLPYIVNAHRSGIKLYLDDHEKTGNPLNSFMIC